MANTKISALPASTTPLAGTEVLPIVQSSTTKQVSVANLTAGRAVATGALTVTGAATVSTTLAVTGAATLSSTLGVTGATTLSSLVTTTGTIATTPSGSTDIANKAYVDTVAQGLDTKASVVAGTTANITLSGTQTVDGVVLIAGDRVLVKNQTTTANNGLYLCAAGSWTRTTDMDTWAEVPGAYVFVEGGSTLADTGWVCTSDAGGTIGVTAIVWAQFSGAGSGVSSITFGTTGLTPATATTGAVTVAGTLAVANGGTGITSFGTGIATFLGTPSSANLAAALTDETGSGALVFATSPTLVTPTLGVATATSLQGIIGNVTPAAGAFTTVTASTPIGVASGGTSLSTLTANNVILGNGTSAPLFVAPSTSGNVLTSTGSTWASTAPATSGTVTSVAATVPSLFSISGSPITTSGTLAMTYSGTALPVVNGGTGQTSYTNGQLLIGNTTGNTLTKTTLTAGSNITITNGSGAITIASSSGASAATPTALGTVYGNQTTSGGTPFLTAYGYNAGVVNTGVNNTFLGVSAGLANTSGTDCVALGYRSLRSNISGTSLIAIGVNTLGLNTTNDNCAVGYNAAPAVTTGGLGTYFGNNAGRLNVTGIYMTAIGNTALDKATGISNTAVGFQAGYGLTSGIENVYLGSECGGATATGSYNVIIGSKTAQTATGASNTYVGRAVANSSTSGDSNSGYGTNCLLNLTTGGNNVAVGTSAGTQAGVVDITSQSNYITIGNNTSTNAYIKIAWTVTSDARDKTEVQPVPHGLSFVNQLNPVSFKFNTSREDATPTGDVRYGFLAQDILALEGSDSVVIDAKDSENLKYTDQNMTAILVKAIQELKAEFDAYKATHP